MKKFILKLGRKILLQMIAFALLVGAIVFAATITWPSEYPDGNSVDGKIVQYFTNMLRSCGSGEVLQGLSATGALICVANN